MTSVPHPVVLVPRFKPRPWGGRNLAALWGKALPPDVPIGEAWELVSLPGDESTVRDGPLAGRTLADLVALWGADLLGAAPLVADRFPLLIKFLDAAQNLSIQVHPKPAADDPLGWQPGIKHESWYVLHAAPGARLYAGLRDGVGPTDIAQAMGKAAIVDLLVAWPVQVGECYTLPSGTLHALGAGLVVAEVQTPSDVTYRAYDWDRAGLDGRPRELHIEAAIANTRYDVTPAMVRPPVERVATALGTGQRVARTARYVMDVYDTPTERRVNVPAGELRVWMVLEGAVGLETAAVSTHARAGDVVLIPAAASVAATVQAGSRWLDVTLPTADANR